MDSANGQVSKDKIAEILGSFRKRGIRLWSENGRLHYKAPSGALTQDELQDLRISRNQIVALLEGTNDGQIMEPRLESGSRLDRAPLALSQQAHWNIYKLAERPAIRQIASATRVRGRLDIDAFHRSVAEIVRRHDALRTRVVVMDARPIQEISKEVAVELQLSDLTALTEKCCELEVERQFGELILAPIDVAADPLFGIRLLKLRDEEYVVIAVMEHMISDDVSMRVLLRELFAAYARASRGRAFSLPPVSMQFADYSVWQRNAQGPWLEKRGAYWNERLAECPRVRFPTDENTGAAAGRGWGTVPLEIGRSLKQELREWCRLRGTTLVLGVFTAYVGLVLRWCNVTEAVIQYVIDGRVSHAMENSIGYFASILGLRLRLGADDSFIDLLQQITQEYCRAHELAHFPYFAARMPRPEFTRNTAFNWVSRGADFGSYGLDESEDAISCSPIQFAHPALKQLELDHEPAALLYEIGDEVVGAMYFPLNRFSVDIMESFGRNFLLFVQAMLRRPNVRVNDISLV